MPYALKRRKGSVYYETDFMIQNTKTGFNSNNLYLIARDRTLKPPNPLFHIGNMYPQADILKNLTAGSSPQYRYIPAFGADKCIATRFSALASGTRPFINLNRSDANKRRQADSIS